MPAERIVSEYVSHQFGRNGHGVVVIGGQHGGVALRLSG